MSRKKVVIVDDDASIRRTFNLLLTKKYSVFLARDGREVKARFERTPIDLIIADFRLPQVNGLQMIRELRQAGYQGRIILISAFPEQVAAEELKELKVDSLFIKPLDLKAMTEAIDLLLAESPLAKA